MSEQAKQTDPPLPTQWSEMTDGRRKDMLDWVVMTCLLFGAQRHTAYKVAAAFAEGLDRETGL